MNLLVHASAGALVGQFTGSPALAFLYGILSHIILDLIPHGDNQIYQRYKNKEVSVKKVVAMTTLDAVACVIFVLLFLNLGSYDSKLIITMAMLGATIPDIFIGFYELSLPNPPKILKLIHKWHFKNHDFISDKYDFSLKNGLLLQLILFLILIKIL